MNVSSPRRLTGAQRSSSTPGLRRAVLVRALRGGWLLPLAAIAACGGGSDEDGDELPSFVGNGPSQGGGGTSATTAPPAGPADALPACTPGTPGCSSVPEAMNPNTPIDQTGNEPVAAGCTPNSASCTGNVLTRCDALGAPLPPQDCAASGGGTCGQVGGVASCIAPACTPSAVTCDGANTISTCSADGSSEAVTRCADGTVCEGSGTCAPVSCNPQELTTFNGGEATVYWFGQGTVNFGNIACGYGIQPGNLGNGDGDAVNGIAAPTLFAAMNTQNFEDAAACGACVEMSYQGRTVTVTVVDECPIGSNPTCTAGHIDLSRGAWNQLTGNAPGTQIFGVNWRYVPCETQGKVTLELKEPDNAYFNEFLVRDHRYPIAKAEVLREDGTWVETVRQRYNFFRPPEDDMGTYRVRLTDINGGVIEEQLELAPGLQGGNAQFDCQ